MASQKTTASWTPGKSATPTQHYTDGSSSGGLQQVKYEGFCRFDSLMPLTWCSTVTGNIQVCCFQLAKMSLFCSIKYVQVLSKRGRRQHLEVSCRSAIKNILKVKVSGTRVVIYEDSIKFLLFYRHICMQVAE